MSKSKPLTPLERVGRLFKAAQEKGLDGPSEGMIADVICDAEFDALYNYEIVAARHGQSIADVKRLLKREKTKQAKERRWNVYLAELDSVE